MYVCLFTCLLIDTWLTDDLVIKGACSEIFGKLIFIKLADMITFPN